MYTHVNADRETKFGTNSNLKYLFSKTKNVNESSSNLRKVTTPFHPSKVLLPLCDSQLKFRIFFCLVYTHMI